ncbi:MAG TPA: hypothetical protein VN253_20995 [Kofleriaceae bacterium]|nr:hypothetical protein [Kofleriaceae bacterium]
MRPGPARELAAAGGLAAALAAELVLTPWAHVLVVSGAVMMALVGWTWRRHAHEWLQPRIASSFLSGFAGFVVTMLAIAEVGVSALVLAAAAGAAGAAALERSRLRGAPMPTQGEARGRVAFEGTAHALGDPPRVPGADREVALWLVRQGRRRWSSTGRIELRDEQRKVWIEPDGARVRRAPWVVVGPLRRAMARALDGADPSGPIRVWSFRDGDRVHVVGEARLEDDPSAASFRDPGRVHVFSGDVLVGAGWLADARRRAHARLLIWSALAACAGGLVVARLAGLLAVG